MFGVRAISRASVLFVARGLRCQALLATPFSDVIARQRRATPPQHLPVHARCASSVFSSSTDAPEPTSKAVAASAAVPSVGGGGSGAKKTSMLAAVALVKVGDGEDTLFRHAELMRMDCATLLMALAESEDFAASLKDVPLDKCTVLVLRSASEVPSEADERAAMKLIGADTIADTVIGATEHKPVGGSKVFVRVQLPNATSNPAEALGPAKDITFFLWTNRLDDTNLKMVPTLIEITVGSQEELNGTIEDNGGGNLVKADSQDVKLRAVRRLEKLEANAAYVLIGGKWGEVRLHRSSSWTQAADKLLRNEAFKVVAADATYGDVHKFTEFDNIEDHLLIAADGTKMAIDGLAVNGEVAVVMEAKQYAHVDHISIVKAKAKHVARIAAERPQSRLGTITYVILVLAAQLFSVAMQRACEAQGVGVVKPSGKRLAFLYRPHPSARTVVVQPPAGDKATRGSHAAAAKSRLG